MKIFYGDKPQVTNISNENVWIFYTEIYTYTNFNFKTGMRAFLKSTEERENRHLSKSRETTLAPILKLRLIDF